MPEIPRAAHMDETLGLKLDGYTFISRRCERLHTDIFETRLLLRRVVCLRGRDAAMLFYDTSRFERNGAAPSRLQKTLLGVGSVQGLDGDAHRDRKGMFMSLMGAAHMEDLSERFVEVWRGRVPSWSEREQVVLLHESREILCRAVCDWSGLPLPVADLGIRTGQLTALIEGSGAVGPRHWRGRRARRKVDAWVTDLVEQTRRGAINPPESTTLHVFATHRDHNGRVLDAHTAAVEVVNVVRPVVAIARYIVFLAVALHSHRGWRERLTHEHGPIEEAFVHEVRRYYPFFPFIVARTTKDVDWRGYRIPGGRDVILDLYGTNHHPDFWDAPEIFRPERFLEHVPDAYTLVPQGGGEHHAGHRCAGEWITIEVMKRALRLLTRELRYEVPRQDLTISLSRTPAVPKSRFIMTNVAAA